MLVSNAMSWWALFVQSRRIDVLVESHDALLKDILTLRDNQNVIHKNTTKIFHETKRRS
jgi:hypothetical protein